MEKIILFYFVLTYTNLVCCQVNDFKKVTKIEQISSHESLYSKDKIITFKTANESRNISTCLNSSTHIDSKILKHNQNFTVYKRHLITIQFRKICIKCNKEEYENTPWDISLEVQNLDNLKATDGFNLYPSPVLRIGIPNYKEVIYSQHLIGFDFYQFDGNLFLILSSNDKLYLYKMEGELKDNNWQLEKTIALKKPLKAPIKTRVKGSELLIYDDNSSYKLLLKSYQISKTKITQKERNSVVFYDHNKQQYSTISNDKANEYIAKSKQ